MLIQYTHYPTIVTEHKTQFFTHFSKKINKNWLFQRVTYDTSFGYFDIWENLGLNGLIS